MKNGFLIPENIYPDDMACVIFKIPNDPLYRQAVRGHVWELARWFNWEQTQSGDTRASEVATLFREMLLDTLVISDDCLEAIEDSLPEGTIVTTTEDLCKAVECGIINVFERAISGQVGNVQGSVTINTDGTVTVGSGQGSVPTEVTAQRSRMGVMELIETELEAYIGKWDDLYTQYGAIDTPTLVYTTAFYQALSQLYLFEVEATSEGTDLFSQTVVNYDATKQSGSPNVPENLNNLDRVFYCKGYDKTTIAQFIFDDGLDKPILRSDMIKLLSPDQFSLWVEQSTLVSDDYINTACYFRPNYDTQALADNYAGNNALDPIFLGVLSGSVELLISGEWTGTQGGNAWRWDGMYTYVNGSDTYAPLRCNAGGGSSFQPTTQPQPSNNGYSCLYNIIGTLQGIIQRNFDDVTGLTGTIEITRIDR